MKSFFTALTVAAAAVSVAASPIKRAPSDTDILQYALTLEHLENAFYSGALAQFDEDAFSDAGYEDWVRGRFEQIAEHEAAHVAFLSGALGSAATKPCTYNFPYTDVQSFAALSATLEGVGVSAYLGAAQYIKTPAYLTAAGAVLTTESRHQAWVNSAVNHLNPWSGALDTPLDLDQVYTLAAGFITSCPSTNPALPVKAFPAFTYEAKDDLHAGSKVKITSKLPGDKKLHVAFFNGLSTLYAPIEHDEVKLPEGLAGTVYAVITSSDSAVSDDNTVAGPAIFTIPVPATRHREDADE
ncbi:hypothetical protein BOTBODRAFT_44612 [Botryobasidium botryosum FD-172 SS1]|uniref:Ferritin-like domain-containing protein n=1 Tax=Botryobasidium botryosum (strain FD-172 SS1) TaxID=930990 RepID=A0A067MG61_BOTB1|nr:hypothetical protein BOTBODRAFT_44612 [Botryobasidium botryosum FD-172 SS1]